MDPFSQSFDELLEGVDLDELDDYDLGDSPGRQRQDTFCGFKTAGGSSLPPPSASALAKAQSLFDSVATDIKVEEASDAFVENWTPSPGPIIDSDYIPSSDSLKRRRVGSSLFKTAGGKDVPPPSEASRHRIASIFDEEVIRTASSEVNRLGEVGSVTSSGQFVKPVRNMASALLDDTGSGSAPPGTFRSPLIQRTPLQTRTNLPAPRPIQIKTAANRLGLSTPRSQRPVRSKFVTPFKTPRPALLTRPRSSSKSPILDIPIFDLNKPMHRESLRQAFLKPQFHSLAEMEELGLPEELWMLDLSNAKDYSFVGEDTALLNSRAALCVLRNEGCRLATAKWVDNHWCQILWKLAGQVQAQSKLFVRRWNWAEVIKQLKYRYEREFLACQRPIIRKIQEHDASAASPMVLAVSAVHATGADEVHLDLTDGWYSIQAELDATLAKAVNTGKIVVGRKLAMSGARDGTDVLDAWHKSRIKLCGNSCHLARWDARLGVSLPFIASLSSITSEGGAISLMGIVVEKLYPIAFVPASKGDSYEPPWNEEEEIVRQEKWKDKFESELALRTEAALATCGRLQDVVELLKSQAQDAVHTNRSSEVDIDELLETLLTAADIARSLRGLTTDTIAALAIEGERRLYAELESARRTAEQEAQMACPPRQVREFRSARIVDMVSGLRPSFREGLLNVWDSKTVPLEEGGRYYVTNLYPSKSGDWSIPKTEGARKQVYLHTRRDTKWESAQSVR